MKLTKFKKMWIVISENHPQNNEPVMLEYTMAYTRKESISKMSRSVNEWRSWKRNHNYKCVRCRITIETLID